MSRKKVRHETAEKVFLSVNQRPLSPRLESNTSNEMENNNIANDVKTSLASLEVVRVKSINSESLSSDEIQSAQSNLSDIIRTAESIKANLNSNENSITRTAASNSSDDDDGSSVDDEGIRIGQNALLVDTQLPERRSTTAIGTSEGASEAPKRRLSTPCCIPLQSSEIETRGGSRGRGDDPHRPFSAGFFSRGQSSTVYPQPNDTDVDVEAGVNRNRRIRFSRAIPQRKLPDRGSNWNLTAREAFRIIDENGDGVLQRVEVVRAIEMMNKHGDMNLDGLSAEELADKMMAEVDIDGDGMIDMNEFTEMMRKTSSSEGKQGETSFNHRMSQLAKTVLVAHQKKIETSVIGQDMWLIHPLRNTHATWDIIISILILLTVVTMPLSLGWEELNEVFFGMNLAVDFIFLLDVCKNFCTGYVDENDAIIMDVKLVRRNYLTGFFITDFCSSIPLDLILKTAGVDSVGGTVTGTKQSLKMLKTLRITKLLRLFRINRLFQYLKKVMLLIEETLNIRISDGFTKLMRLGVGALILAHWIGCFNFLLVRLHDFPSDSWVVYAGLVDKSPYVQWSWSFFKALAQMIMIGFETPPFTNVSCDALSDWCTIEYWVTLGCLYLGAIFYSLLISSISSILQTANQASRQFDEHLLKVDDYMRSKKLPAAMREKVKDYFYLQFSNGKLHREEEILDFLSPVLRREIKQFTGRDICRKVPLLSTPTHRDFSEGISCVIEPTIVFANEVIMKEQTTGDEMFFILSGVVEIYVASKQIASYVAIGDGCYFGDVSVLLGVRRTASAKSKTQCMLYRIRKSDLVSLLHDHPAIESRMRNIAQSRRRRLAHYLNPDEIKLSAGDEVDSEDSRTDLFGLPSEDILNEKDEEYNQERLQSGIRRRTFHHHSQNRRRNALPIKSINNLS